MFCKAPEPGRVKTRLARHIGDERAAELHRLLAWRCLSMLAQAQLATLELWCAPTPFHPFFRQCESRIGVTLRAQGEGDLGVRMARAFALPAAAPTVVIGTDCPPLDARYVACALERLSQGAKTVLGPAEDGGYVLLGMHGADASRSRLLFRDIPWGTDQVLEETLRRLDGRVEQLPVLWDVDRYPDLLRLGRDAIRLELGEKLEQLIADASSSVPTSS